MILVASKDVSEQLNKNVDSILEEYDLEVLSGYWDLAKRVLPGHTTRRFYVQAQEGYGNIAILTDDVVADVIGDDREDEGHVAVHRISAFSGIDFYKEQVPTVPGSDEAELVIVANAAGSDTLGLHWMANTDEEAKHLLEFGRSLMTSLAGSAG